MTAFLAAAQLPSALNTMPTAIVVDILCAAVVVEIVALPAVLLPGGTITLLAGALIGAAGLRYRAFAIRALVLRIPWLAAALGAGALAADSITRIGHVAGVVGIAASCVVITGLLIARRRAASARRAKG